jgi:hypothetical protein
MRLLVLVCFLFHRRACRLGSQTTNRFFNYSRDIPEEYWATSPVFRFLDARNQMKENLRFLLRAATATQPFAYFSDQKVSYYSAGHSSDIYYPEYFMARQASPTKYEWYGYRVYSPNLGYSVIEEKRPIQEHFLWRNFIFDANAYTNGSFYTGAWPCLDLVDRRRVNV